MKKKINKVRTLMHSFICPRILALNSAPSFLCFCSLSTLLQRDFPLTSPPPQAMYFFPSPSPVVFLRFFPCNLSLPFSLRLPFFSFLSVLSSLYPFSSISFFPSFFYPQLFLHFYLPSFYPPSLHYHPSSPSPPPIHSSRITLLIPALPLSPSPLFISLQ